MFLVGWLVFWLRLQRALQLDRSQEILWWQAAHFLHCFFCQLLLGWHGRSWSKEFGVGFTEFGTALGKRHKEGEKSKDDGLQSLPWAGAGRAGPHQVQTLLSSQCLKSPNDCGEAEDPHEGSSLFSACEVVQYIHTIAIGPGRTFMGCLPQLSSMFLQRLPPLLILLKNLAGDTLTCKQHFVNVNVPYWMYTFLSLTTRTSGHFFSTHSVIDRLPGWRKLLVAETHHYSVWFGFEPKQGDCQWHPSTLTTSRFKLPEH